VNPTGWDFSLSDADGKPHTAKEWGSARAVALFFLATECPISNRYAPEINRLAAEFEKQGVLFYGVQSDPAVSAAAARQHSQDYGFKFPMLMDPAQTLAGKTGVLLTPTSVILSPKGDLLYRGRIDNRYLDFGKYRDADIQPDFRLALESVLAGKPVAEPITKPIGCALPPIEASSTRR
jgi:peroxiredoxin